MENQINFLMFGLDNEVHYLANAGNFAVIDVLWKIEGLAAVHDLEFAAGDLPDVLEFQLHIVEEQFVDLHEKILLGLVLVQVDGPPQPHRHSAALAGLVEIHLHAVLELVAAQDGGLAREAVVDETGDFDGFGESHEDVAAPDWQHELAVLRFDCEVVGGGCCTSGAWLTNKRDVFDDQVVLRNALQILVAEEYFLLLIDAEAEGQNFQLPRLHLPPRRPSGAQFGEFQVEAEHDHAVLPPLQGNTIRNTVFEAEKKVVLQTSILVVEGPREVLLLLVRD